MNTKKDSVIFTQSKEKSNIFDKKVFTLLNNTYSKDNITYVSLNDVVNILNCPQYLSLFYSEQDKEKRKLLQKGLLKGIFKNTGKSPVSKDLYENTIILFFDIDIKPLGENSHLYHDAELRDAFYSEIKKIAVLTWRSSSGLGIAGFIAVEGLDLTFDNLKYVSYISKKHYELSKFFYKQLEEKYKKYNVVFDIAQGKLRQIRYLTPQKNKVEINENYTVFFVDGDLYDAEAKKQHEAYKFQLKNDNNNTNIDKKFALNILEKKCNEIINDNNSVHNKTLSVCSYIKSIVNAGYLSLQTAQIELKKAVETAYKLQNREPNKQSIKLCILDYEPPFKFHYIEYSNTYLEITKTVNDFKLKPDSEITVNNYVGEAETDICNFIKKLKKLLLFANTGTGKTTLIQYIISRFFDKKILICMPTIPLAEQYAKDCNNEYNCLTGANSDEIDFFVNDKRLIATYDQASKIAHLFDIVIIDELHNVINQMNFRDDILIKLLKTIEKNKNIHVVGLTGTPHNLFNFLDFYILKVNVKNYIFENIKVRKAKNLNSFDTAIFHYHEHKSNNKTSDDIHIYNLNCIENIKIFKDFLIGLGIDSNDIFCLYADDKIKNSADYKLLINEGIFNENIKFVLCTSFINEGINIKDRRVKQMIYISNQWLPNPDNLRQFLARCRDKSNVEYYYYHAYKTKKYTLKDACEHADYLIDYYNNEVKNINNLHDLAQNINCFDSNDKDKIRTTINEKKFFYLNEYTQRYEINKLTILHEARKFEYENYNDNDFFEYLKVNHKLTFEFDDVNTNFSNDFAKDIKVLHKEQTDKIIRLFIENTYFFICIVLFMNKLDKKLRKLANANSYFTPPELIYEMKQSEIFNLFSNNEINILCKKIVFKFLECKNLDLTNEQCISIIFSEKKGLLKLDSQENYNRNVKTIGTHKLINTNDNELSKVNLIAKNKFIKIFAILLNLKGKKFATADFRYFIETNYRKNIIGCNDRNYILFIKDFFDVKDHETKNGKKIYSIQNFKNLESYFTEKNLKTICEKTELIT